MTTAEQYKKFEELDKLASQGGGVERVERQHANGHMTARERIDMLLDKGTFNEMDKFVIHHCTDFGMDKNHIPGDGIVCGYGKIDGRLVYVYAYDFTVYGGTLSATGAQKIVKVQELALKNGAPVIALNDSGGARIQEGVGSISGYASIFYQNTIASGVIPQISAILGPCAGGACYSPALTDFIFMVKEKSHMFITGPDVVKAVTHEEVDKEELGGAYTHSSKSGVTHFLCDTEEETLMSIRELLSFLPSNNMEDAPMIPCTDDIRRAEESLMTVIPDDPNMPYDIKNIIEPVVDNHYFFEVMPHFAKNIVVGFARLGGRSVGIVANQPAYLAGYLADRYDVPKEECIGRAKKRIRRSTEREFRNTVKGYHVIDQEKANMEIKDQAKYALYPVWILNTTWKGKKYIFAMNGQTGKIVGDLPADNGAFWRFIAMWGAGIGLVLYALLWVFMVLL